MTDEEFIDDEDDTVLYGDDPPAWSAADVEIEFDERWWDEQ